MLDPEEDKQEQERQKKVLSDNQTYLMVLGLSSIFILPFLTVVCASWASALWGKLTEVFEALHF